MTHVKKPPNGILIPQPLDPKSWLYLLGARDLQQSHSNVSLISPESALNLLNLWLLPNLPLLFGFGPHCSRKLLFQGL